MLEKVPAILNIPPVNEAPLLIVRLLKVVVPTPETPEIPETITVLPDAALKVPELLNTPEIVRVLPPFNVTVFPELIVRLATVGETSIAKLLLPPVVIVTIAPEAGTPVGLQLLASFQLVLFAPVQVLAATNPHPELFPLSFELVALIVVPLVFVL